LDEDATTMLSGLIEAAEEIAGIQRHTGRSSPDVIT
jgi:hypothetical protein